MTSIHNLLAKVNHKAINGTINGTQKYNLLIGKEQIIIIVI